MDDPHFWAGVFRPFFWLLVMLPFLAGLRWVLNRYLRPRLGEGSKRLLFADAASTGRFVLAALFVLALAGIAADIAMNGFN